MLFLRSVDHCSTYMSGMACYNFDDVLRAWVSPKLRRDGSVNVVYTLSSVGLKERESSMNAGVQRRNTRIANVSV